MGFRIKRAIGPRVREHPMFTKFWVDYVNCNGTWVRVLDPAQDSLENCRFAWSSCYFMWAPSGFWAITSEWQDATLRIEASGPPLTQNEVAQIRAMAVEVIREHPKSEIGEFAEWVSQGRGRFSRPIITGYIHNAFSLSLFGVLMFSAVSCVHRRYVAARLLQLRIRRQCPKCEYLLRSSYEDGCPECGWRRDDESSA